MRSNGGFGRFMARFSRSQRARTGLVRVPELLQAFGRQPRPALAPAPGSPAACCAAAIVDTARQAAQLTSAENEERRGVMQCSSTAPELGSFLRAHVLNELQDRAGVVSRPRCSPRRFRKCASALASFTRVTGLPAFARASASRSDSGLKVSGIQLGVHDEQRHFALHDPVAARSALDTSKTSSP